MLVEVVDVVRNEVGQVAIFGLVPNVFDGIKIGRIGRQPLHAQPGATLFLKAANRRAVDGPAVADQQQWPTQSVMDSANESDHVLRCEIMVGQVVVQTKALCPGSDGEGAQCTEAIMSIPGVLDRRLATRSPDAAPQRLQQKPAFVEKDQASLAIGPLFLAAATCRGARRRRPVRSVPWPAARVSGHSSPVCGAAFPRNRRDTALRTSARSTASPAGTSRPAWQSPSAQHRAAAPPANVGVAAGSSAALGRHGAWTAALGSRAVPVRPSNGSPTKRWNPPPQPLPSAFSPAPEAALRSGDGLPAPREFQKVSCIATYSRTPARFHYLPRTQ